MFELGLWDAAWRRLIAESRRLIAEFFGYIKINFSRCCREFDPGLLLQDSTTQSKQTGSNENAILITISTD